MDSKRPLVLVLVETTPDLHARSLSHASCMPHACGAIITTMPWVVLCALSHGQAEVLDGALCLIVFGRLYCRVMDHEGRDIVAGRVRRLLLESWWRSETACPPVSQEKAVIGRMG